ncbi:MAG: ABC transporter ATP-binding protein [Armatimonadetes bacterium]|nr:ABC transporter ATP-binding protein [Akkermansiaceae bacterium]
MRGRVASLLEVGTGFHPELSGRENIYLNGAILGMKKSEIDRKFDEIVSFAEVDAFIDTPVKRYSSGMYVRLAFAVAAHLEPEILIIDEVLAVGDLAFQKKCLGKMDEVARGGRTVIFVSHNMGAVSQLCETVAVLDAGRMLFRGSAEEGVETFSRQLLGTANGSGGRLPHVIYCAPEGAPAEPSAITRIEMLDANGRPKGVVATWDTIVIRIVFSCEKRILRGSVVLRFDLPAGPTVILLSTQPDGALPLTFEVGEQYVECAIEKLPLAAGQYMIHAGLAIPNAEWLWRKEIGFLTVMPADVYESGLAPKVPRTLIALKHTWMRPKQ